MADFKKRLAQLVQNAKLYWRGYQAAFKLVGKNILLFIALRVALVLFFRKK